MSILQRLPPAPRRLLSVCGHGSEEDCAIHIMPHYLAQRWELTEWCKQRNRGLASFWCTSPLRARAGIEWETSQKANLLRLLRSPQQFSYSPLAYRNQRHSSAGVVFGAAVDLVGFLRIVQTQSRLQPLGFKPNLMKHMGSRRHKKRSNCWHESK